ncbi:hypothetical protein HY489_05150 [Candidatus Woesearchaeota archaeon]|nr:hypothetical protein [Candidatus Woesearchaeota archaeon]
MGIVLDIGKGMGANNIKKQPIQSSIRVKFLLALLMLVVVGCSKSEDILIAEDVAVEWVKNHKFDTVAVTAVKSVHCVDSTLSEDTALDWLADFYIVKVVVPTKSVLSTTKFIYYVTIDGRTMNITSVQETTDKKFPKLKESDVWPLC